MVDLPWRSDSGDDDPIQSVNVEHDETDAILTCEFHDGSLALSEEAVVIDRADRSDFEDKTIPFEDIVDVEYAKGITIGYLQIEVVGVAPDEGGWFSDPVNENTLHFGRRSRGCATEMRDEILARARGERSDQSGTA